MATVSEIRDRLAVVLGQVDGIKTVVKRPAESPPAALPAVVIGEPSAQFAEGESRRGLDIWEFGLLVLVSSGDYQLAAEALDGFLERTGPRSIRQAIADNSSLGLLDGTRAYFDRMDEYGPRDFGQQKLAGAVLTLIVRTSG